MPRCLAGRGGIWDVQPDRRYVAFKTTPVTVYRQVWKARVHAGRAWSPGACRSPVSPLLTRSRSRQDHGSIEGAGAPVNPPIARRVGCSELYG